MSISLSFPDVTYTTANKPSVLTLKSDLSLIETDLNAHEADTTIHNTVTTLLQSVYPVGSVYTNKTVATNPAILFGFGTWAAIAGRVVVGLDATQTEFDVLGETGGEKTHLLTGAESGEKGHGHSGTFASSYHDHTRIGGSTGWSSGGSPMSGPTSTASVAEVGASSASSAHNNLQPYVVCHVWERLA
jgi:hypothetical protein